MGMEIKCSCERCAAVKQGALDGIKLVETKINEEFSKKIYTMGMPKNVIKNCIDAAKREVA